MSATRTEPADMKLEKAVAAYLRAYRDPNADNIEHDGEIERACSRAGHLAGVNIYEGRSTDPRSFPSIVVECSQSTKLFTDADWFEVRCDIQLFTHRNESELGVKRAEIAHAYRAGDLEDLLCIEDMQAAINKAPAIPDVRDVTGITIMGGYHEDSAPSIVGDAHVQAWSLILTVMPSDAPQ